LRRGSGKRRGSRSARTPNKSIRLRGSDGTRISVNSYAKGEANSQVALQHEKLPGAADVVRKKKYWGDLLAAISEPRA
jgi:hypothetical protein